MATSAAAQSPVASYQKLEQILAPEQLSRTDELSKLRGTVVKLSEESHQAVVTEHYQDLLSASPAPLRGNTFTLVMGANGAGKTTQIIPMLLREKGGAVVVGTDEARPKVVAAFKKSVGDGECQEPLYTQSAARQVSIDCQNMAFADGFNVVASTVGYDKKVIEGTVSAVKAHGYQVDLVCASIPGAQVVRRLADRNFQGADNPEFGIKQPFIPLNYALRSDHNKVLPEDVFDLIAQDPQQYGIRSVAKYSTDVEEGQPPVQLPLNKL